VSRNGDAHQAGLAVASSVSSSVNSGGVLVVTPRLWADDVVSDNHFQGK
jgi:hypothetical protein